MKRTSLCMVCWAASLVVAVSACVSTASVPNATEPSIQAHEPTSQPSSQPTSLPTSQPSSADGEVVDAEAALDPLVQRMRAYIGDPYAASRIEFTFVFFAGVARVASRTYDWRPGAGTLTVGTGRRAVEFRGLQDVDPSSATEHPRRHSDVWRSVAPGARARRAARAWSGFINDRYWLLAPALATGPDTEVSVEGDAVHVFFPSGGVTPGDRYQFVVDPETGAVTEWEFRLASGREGAFEWRDYEAFGPMHLSLRRVSPAGPFELRFEDVRVE